MVRSISFCFLIYILHASSGSEVSQADNADHKETSPEQWSALAFEELVQRNKEAQILWNIARKYNFYNAENLNETCVKELQEKDEFVLFYLVNITLQESGEFINKYYFNGDDYGYFYFSSDLKKALFIYGNRSEIISDQREYLTIIKQRFGSIGFNVQNNQICYNAFNCSCISETMLRTFESQVNRIRKNQLYLREFILFGNYVDPILRIIVILIGLVLNSTMLFVFIKEKSLITESNILIFNQVVNNFLVILLYLPTNYVASYHLSHFKEGNICRAIQALIISANTALILLLNIQRYLDISRVLKPSVETCKLTPSLRCVIYMTSLWVWSVGMAFIFGLLDPRIASPLEATLYCLLYILGFSITLAIFNSLTARKLQHAAEQGRTSEFQHIMGSSVILFLTAAYYSTHIPFFIFRVFDVLLFGSGFHYFTPTTFRVIIFFLNILFFLYPSINIAILYRNSSTYRNFLRKYLFHCWNDLEDGRYITMSSVQNTENQS